jgi:hypothetical protein
MTLIKKQRNQTSPKKINIGQSAHFPTTYTGVFVGKEAIFMGLKTKALKSILGQRLTSKTKASGFLKKAGGWSWYLYSPILVAKIPNEAGTYSYYVYDGDHRLMMYRMVFGDEKTIPCYVQTFKEQKEVAELFNQINARRRTSVTKEQQFICDFFAENSEVIELEKILRYVGLRVADNPKASATNTHEIPLGSSDPHIPVNALRQCVKISDDNVAFEKATSLLKKSFPNDDELLSELVQGLTFLFQLYEKSFQKTKRGRVADPYAKFCEFFEAYTTVKGSQKELANAWKESGGRVHHKEKECIALGMLKDFVKSNYGSMLKGKFSLKKLKDLL